MPRTEEFDLVLPAALKKDLFSHLFPGDGEEHGAVLSAGVVDTDRGLRLLARDFFAAADGEHYVPGRRGHRMLTPQFVNECIRYCRDEHLAYLAVHNHPGMDDVRFSGVDLESHERGYPALLDIAQGRPVGAIVFANRAAAGDLWLSGNYRLPLRECRVVGRTIDRLYPSPPPVDVRGEPIYDRQVRLFADAGQTLLRDSKVGIIGAGGVGSIVINYLAHLGVGHMLVADPDFVDPTNLPRLLGAIPSDAYPELRERRRWLRRLFNRKSSTAGPTKKVDVMRRVVESVNNRIIYEGIDGDIVNDAVAQRYRDCDFIFLAADLHTARYVFNSLVHQFLIPGIQIGSKIEIDMATDDVLDIRSNVRPVGPDFGCLDCAKLINGYRLQEEAMSKEARARQQYVPGEPAASVVTLNAIGASIATNDFMLAWTGLTKGFLSNQEYYLHYYPRTQRLTALKPLRDNSCEECGSGSGSRLARGDSRRLPTIRLHEPPTVRSPEVVSLR